MSEERLQDLENELIKYQETCLRQADKIFKLEQQNMSYREYFQHILDADKRLVDKQYFKDIANDALESES